jgi:mono/diheme cytochrome c family protein
MMPAAMLRRPVLAFAVAAAGLSLGACGTKNTETEGTSADRGAQLFAERCSGCHQLDQAGTEGGALKVGDRERTDGPNFNVRKETKDQVLYAIRNGGFSGAIMPENIVVGEDAEAVAEFLSKVAGSGEGN